MFNSSDRWKQFWEKQTLPLWGPQSDPRHVREREEFHDAYGKEVALLFAGRTFDRVLEIGCGNGEFLKPLGFDKVETYCGVDLSESMIAEFNRLYPGYETKVYPGETYLDGRQYDLIFSTGTIQYFKPAMVDEHFRNAAKMLAPGGRIICAAIPWKIARFTYRCGYLTPGTNPGLVRYFKSWISRMREDHMGEWYHHNQIQRLAAKHGFQAKFFGSVRFPYRFHAVLERVAEQPQTQPLRSAA